ncbi:MAG: hypothetical protein K6L76_12210 [Agarilytica sp.]
MFKKKHALTLAILSTSAMSAQAFENVTVITSAAFQNKNLSFDQKYSGAANNKAEFSVDMPMLSLGTTVVYKKFFTSLKWESNLSDTSTSTKETDRSTVGEVNLIALPDSRVEVGREDISLTFGYNVWKSANIFIGYLSGKTTLKPNPFCGDFVRVSDQNDLDNSPDAPSLISRCDRQNRAGFQYALEDEGLVNNQPTYEQEYTESGLFLGGSYGFSFDDYGTLSLSFAYASMTGKYKDNARDGGVVLDDSFKAFNYKGDSTGTSIAATWTAPLGETSAYTIDLRRQAYSMDGKDQTGNLSGVKLETDEEMLGLTAGVQFYF